MNKAYFEILRAGVNTTIQDKGRNHLYHVGITVSGAIDRRNYKLANYLTNNNLSEAVIEFAYQGPLLRLNNGKGFFNHWTFEFIDVEVKSKKAHVSYKYIPNWNYCEVVPILSQSDRLFFVIKLDFKLNEDGWTINNYSIEDINFGQTFEENPIKCIKDLYKPIR